VSTIRSASRPRRVLIIDADRRVRASLSSVLSLVPGVEVVGAAGDPEAALAILAMASVDVVAIDPRLPDIDIGLGLLSALRRERPGLRIVVMSCDPIEAPSMLGGADAFASKDADTSHFVDAVVGDRGPFARLATPVVATPVVATDVALAADPLV
jgi:DNA-binding NarL/FixJ family response regulator